MAQLSDDCFAGAGSLLDVDAARQMIMDRLPAVAGLERVALRAALGRILAEDVIAPISLPRFDNSAVDGYAARFNDLDPARETTLRCVDRIAAGHESSAPLAGGTAARIFTGAPLPPGADVVLMQEDCRRDGDLVTILPGIKRGANTRRAGEDVAVGSVALTYGRRLGPADLGILAALGHPEVGVRKRLRVTLFSTGDEIRDPGSALSQGQIYDANRFMLTGLLERLGVEVMDRGIIVDNPASLGEALRAAAAESDLIITSGGVSAGDEDHIRAAIANHGSLHFWRLAIKPGRPVAMGQIGGTPLAGLPGNPVAALVTFALVARPMIEALSGTTPHVPRRIPVVSAFSYEKKTGRREFVRVSIDRGRAHLSPKNGAAMMTSLTESDGFAELPAEMTRLAPGAMIDFIAYEELI